MLMTSRYLSVLFLFLISAAFVSCFDGSKMDEQSMNTESAIIPAVEAVKAEIGRLPNEERLTGLVRAINQVEIYAEISAPVEQVFVQNGNLVDKGDLLVKLKEQQLRELYNQAIAGADVSKARARQSKAALNQAENAFNRAKSLADKGLSSDVDFENAEANYISAQANYDLAKAQVKQATALVDQRQQQLEQTEIRAPVSGLIGLRNAEVGMQVNPNMRLFVLGNPNETIVEVSLTESMLDYIKQGQDVRILSDRSDEFFLSAQLNRISPFLDPVTHSTTAEIEIRNASSFLMPGMFVQVDVLYGNSDQATLIPVSALFKHPITGEQGVYIAKSIGTEIQPAEEVKPNSLPPLTEPTDVEFRQVDVLARGRMKAGVNNISPGDWIITVGQDRLTGGVEQAKIRTVSWERVLTLQELQQEDILQEFIEGQKIQMQQKQKDLKETKKVKAAGAQSSVLGDRP